MQQFPPPPRAAEFSELIKKRVEEVKSSGGTRETVTVDWNGQPLNVEVIDLPLSGLYYNPATHRIRAQRTHDAQKDRALESDPWGHKGQEYLESLLQNEPADPTRRDPAFEKLKKSLEEYGQTDPGLITHHGILVNGNTRAAALKGLGAASMRVGVLPESFTWADINAVELSLQLRKDHRRDYSYINRLLAMEEQASLGRTPDVIAKAFRIQVKTYDQERWILRVVRDQIERSQNGNAALRLVDFEDHQEKLKELHRDYSKLAAADPDRAEILKETRMAAITLGFSKTDVRHIEEGFQEKYLSSVLPAGLITESEQEQSIAVPGLGISVPGTSSKVSTARELNRQVLQAKARVAARDSSAEEKSGAQSLQDDLHKAFDKAIDRAGRDARLRKRKQIAPERLMDACAAIELCVDELVKARASHSLDEAAFDEAALKLRESFRQLAHQAGRGSQEPGVGVRWLVSAAHVVVD
ncbi:ParB N-terminal domain-containing protein [Streptomyces sp. NPDC048483]|uniref:ParB N-terminal domain-containing protein n=1 Tax=Streptomyces sp. NPDC048483 TaxID=3154927 RepID=UPI0034268BF9